MPEVIQIRRTTQSSLARFDTCPRAWHWRYQRGIVGQSRSNALAFGSIIHDALEEHHRTYDPARVFDAITRSAVENEAGEIDIFKAQAMMLGYVARWPEDDFRAVELEREFCGPVKRHPTHPPSTPTIIRMSSS